MYSFDLRVRYSEVDNKNRLSIPAFINILQDIATMHSEDIGFGLEYLAGVNQGWFVTSYAIDFFRLPAMGERIKIDTYPYSFKGCVGLRGFGFLDEKGEVFARANSSWAYMNLEKGMPARISPEMQEAYAPFDKPEGIPEIKRVSEEAELEECDCFTVVRAYIDTNGHMNNGVYLELMSRYLPRDFEVKNINVTFKKALFLDDRVTVFKNVGQDACQIVFKCKDELSCIAEYR